MNPGLWYKCVETCIGTLLTVAMCFRGDARPQYLTQEIADTMRILSSPVFLSFLPLIASNLLFDLLIKAG